VKHKHFLFFLVLGLGTALLIMTLAMLHASAQKSSGHSLTDTQTTPGTTSPAQFEDNVTVSPQSDFSPAQNAQSLIPQRLPVSTNAGPSHPMANATPVSRAMPAAILEGRPPQNQPTTFSTYGYDVLQSIGDNHAEAFPLAPPMPSAANLAICMDSNRVWGSVGAGETVTVTVNGAQMGATHANTLGFFWTTLYDANGNRPGLDDGDVVEIYHEGVLAVSVTLRAITGQVDVVNDVVSGAIGGSGFPISVTVYAPEGEPALTSYSQTVSTDGAGNFSADFSGMLDLVIWEEPTVAYVDNGVEVHRHVRPDAGLLVRPWPFNLVVGYTAPGAAVTVTLHFSDTTEKASANLTADGSGWYRWSVPADVLESDYVVVEIEGGTVLSRTVDALSVNVDVANDRVTGLAEAGATVRGRALNGVLTPLGWRETQASTVADTTGVYTLEFGTVGDIMPGQWFGVFVADAEGDDLNTWNRAPSVEVNQTYNEVSGFSISPPGPPSAGRLITLTLYSAHDDTTHIYSKGAGWYGWYDFGTADGLPDIVPGDVVTVESEGYTWQGVVQVMTMTVEADLGADRFTGTVITPTERVELWGQLGTSESYLYPLGGEFNILATTTTATGAFTGTPLGFDVDYDMDYEVSHRTPNDYIERITRKTDGFGAWLPGNFIWATVTPPETPYTITLYDSTGNIKAQTTGNSTHPVGGTEGFDVGAIGQTLEVGDRLQVQSAAGFSQTTVIPALSVTADADTDLVTGYGPANTLLHFGVYRDGNRYSEGFVPSDASGFYAFRVNQLQTVSGDGDLQAGDSINISYLSPEQAWIINQYELPFAEVGVSKWNPGGFARPGGKIVYSIVYWNDGSAVAADTIIVDTLPVSTTYAGDTSGLTPDIGANGVITWHIGDLPVPGNGDNWGVFAVTLDVAADMPTGDGALNNNCATISTSTPGDTNASNNGSCSGAVDVRDSAVGVNVDKWPDPGDPAPGQEFRYHIGWCSDYGANFGPVWLTDTLPVSTTVVSWSADWPWGFWTEVITTGGQFVLYAPGLPGNYCQTIYLRLRVDPNAPEEMQLSNHVIVTTPGDAQPDNNERLNEDARTSNPRYDLNTDKWHNGGVLVPGGWINYGANQWNGGNMLMHNAWLTDTLPAGTTYRPNSARRHDGYNFPPDVASDEIVAWNIGDTPVADGFGFDFSVDIDDSVTPGTFLTNCITIAGAETDNYTPNNTDCVTLQVFDHGPNLRVTKEHWWNGDGQLGYRIFFYNLGDETVSDVWITDTLPADTSWDGWWNLNFDRNRLAEQSLTDDVLAWRFSELNPGDSGNIEFNANLDTPGTPLRWYTNTVTIAPLTGDVDPTDNTYEDVAFSGGEVEWVDFDVYRTRVWGCAPQGPVTVTTALAEMTFGNCWDEQNFPDTFDPGDIVTVTAGAGTHPVIITIPDPFTGYINSNANTVWGQIDALDHQPVQVSLWNFPPQWTETDNQGHYSVAFSDIPHGAQGDVNYNTEMDYARVGFNHRLTNLDLSLNVNYDHDWVEKEYEGGHTVWITVTNDGGDVVKATAVLTTGLIPWWGGGQTGFSTNLNDPWQPQRPDIQPGDWVYAATETGYTATVHIGQITGFLDVEADRITGTVNAPWLMPGPVDVECHTWGAPGGTPNKRDSVIPNGEDTFTCAWDPNTEWDVQPGQDIAVAYGDSQGNWVFAVYRAPAPHLRVEKWLDGGNLGEGSGAVFYVQYRNEGDGDAENVVITDTLQGMTYLDDTSAFPHTGGGNEVVWQLGTVAPGEWLHFYVYAEINAAAGERVTNTAEIATSTPYDQAPPWERYSEWSGEVQPNDTRLNLGKWAWTGDPAAGYDVVFHVNPCNNGGTGSTQLTLTDTLHPALTLQSWWSDAPGWSEVSRDAHTLILTKPSLGSWRCEAIYVRATVDAGASPGLEIWNQAVIYAANDLSPDDNEAWWQGNVNNPHINLNIDKYLNWGQLAPGGELRYGINIHNNGNVPVGAFRITDTLPVSTTFIAAWTNDQTGQHPFAPAFIGDGIVAWDIASLDNAYWVRFEVALQVAQDAIPGTLLVNTAEVTHLPGEDSYDDNVSRWTETLNPAGSNLRVTKEHWWNGNGQLGYRIFFYNLGDTTISDVWITDTLPADTSWDGWWNLNFDRNRLAEQSLTGDVLAWRFSELNPGDTGNIEFNANLDEPGVPVRWYTNTVTIAPLTGDVDPTDNTYEDVAFSGGEVEWVDFDVYRTRVWGCAPQGPVTVTTALAEMTFGNCWDEQNFPDTFDPGDIVTVTAGAGILPVVIEIPDPFTAYASSITDTVWGQIGALANAAVNVNVWGIPSRNTTTDANGHYSVAFPDVPRGAQGDVNANTDIDYAQIGFHRRFQTPDLIVNVDYSNNGVDATYERGHTGWVTVTNDLGTEIRATVEVTTETWPWWGGNSGFSTHHHQWTPSQPDIEPYDWVYAALDNGYTTTVQVGRINAAVDVDNDIVSGTLDVPWYSDGLRVRCEIHLSGAPGIEVGAINPDGSEVFICNYSGLWDIVPGNPVVVRYTEPDGDEVLFRPANPTPHLRVEKWLDGGNLGEGSGAVFYVQYRNEGDGDAENVVITDTLQGMTYLDDTSAFPHTGGGNEVVWQLGTVAPGEWLHFYVYAEINAAAGERVTNTAEIATSNPYDQAPPWERYSEWSGEVQPNDTRLNLGKWAWTGDPAAGYDVVFHVNPCNNGGTGSTQLTLTDTLHPALTLQSWWSDAPGWSEVSRDAHTLILTKPSLGSWRCEAIYVRATVDAGASPGLEIWNQAVIYAANDLSPDDNEAWWRGNVNSPHINLNINKAWDWGQLTPGGELHYNINYQNNGNVPVTSSIRITDTLPISTTFIGISNFYGGPPVTPVFTGTDYVVFEVAGLDNGYSGGFQVALQVDSNALPGTLLTNTVEIERQPVEDNTDDNISTAVETLYPHGPNLRVRKDGGWHGYGEGHNAWYQMVVENVGDEPVTRNVTITDTYPISMSLDGGVGIDWYGGWWDWRDNPAEHYFTATVQPLGPGGRARFNFNTQIPGSDPVPGGLILTNTVEVMLAPTDTYDLDNVDFVVLTTGPDLWLKKDVVSGDFLPGELITFSLTFGNDREGWQWWWGMQGNAVLTDTLPAGMEFVSAQQHWCGSGVEWCENTPTQAGNVLVWDLWPLHASEWNEIYVTVRITDTATGLDAFTNRAEIGSDQPDVDVEPYTDNNANNVDVVIDLPHFEVSKTYESTAVAGMPITYTLTVTNIGNSLGTGIILSDTIPAGLEDVNGGTILLPWVLWYIDSLAPHGGVATETFNATLPCSGVVTNVEYHVVSSDQGVASENGAPVAVTVLTPTLAAGFEQSAADALIGTTFYFTGAATTNGPAIGEWAWDFGDGSAPVFTQNAAHAYTRAGTFTVTLTVSDTCGYVATASSVVTIAAPTLVASFTQSTLSAVVGTTIFFTDTSTTNAPPIIAWVWDFGDGSAPVLTQNATHAYTRAGTFTVTLTVSDTFGYADTTSGVVTITAPALVAGFTQSTLSAVVGTTIFFTDTSTTNAPPIIAWVWDFGDGSAPVLTQNAAHAYTRAGTFTVTLTVTDTFGYADTTSGVVTITAPALVAGFTQSTLSAVVGTTIFFTDTSTTNAPPIIAWAWDFGDGSARAFTQNAAHAYTRAGTFTVTLTVTDTLGYQDTHAEAIQVLSGKYAIFLPLVLRNN